MSIEALNASIAKWERNAVAATPEEYKIGPKECALCDLYQMSNSTCADCPIMTVTGRNICEGTPYRNAHMAQLDWSDAVDLTYPPNRLIDFQSTAHEAARKEVKFLKKVRATVYPEYKTSTEEK